MGKSSTAVRIPTADQREAVDHAGSAVERVIEAVKAGVRRGRYVSGQRLIEPDLIRELGVSRGSLREALRRLESVGLVQIELYRGASIQKISRTKFMETNQLRGLLEGLAASLAAERMDESERKALIEIEQAWDRGTRRWSFPEYNEKFHAAIVAASRHSMIPAFLEQSQLVFFQLQFHRIQRTQAEVKQSRDEHRRVVKAILKGDPKGAERAMRDHVYKAGQAVLNDAEEFFAR
jgi:DNA-binding GntR family transcriptional regulator